MSISDRILPLCDLLMGAAYADDELRDQEKAEVRALVEELAGGLTAEISKRIDGFDPKKFDVVKTAEPFRTDPEDDRRKLLFLVSAVNESDEEIDFAEDDYLRALAKALDLPAAALAGLTVDIEDEQLKETFQQVRKGPPPPPPKGKGGSVDVDMD